VNLYRFCLENCIAGMSGALVEVQRGMFKLVGNVSPQVLERLRSACTAVVGQYLGGRFAFSEIRQADEFASTVSGMGIEVHTLKSHVEALASYLQMKKESFKTALDAAEHTIPGLEIRVLDPSTRRWKPSRLDEIDKTGSAVLCDGSSFYIAQYGRIVKVPKEEAYLFALLNLYREKSITGLVDASGSFIGIKLSDVGNLPDSVFYTLARLQATRRKGSQIMLYYRADIDTLSRALRLAKLNLIVATEIVKLTHKRGVIEVGIISPHLASKEADLVAKVLRALGYTIKYGDQYIEVELDGGPLRIYLTRSSKYFSGYLSNGGKAILIPLHYLLTPDDTLYAFKMIRTYGFSIITAGQWTRVLEKLCELAEGKPAEALKLAAEALLASRSKPEIFTALASNPTLKEAASSLIQLAARGISGTPLDKLPPGELTAIWRRLQQIPP